MDDITKLILDDHTWLRQAFAALDDAHGDEALRVAWDPVANRLDTHAAAEEAVLYPALLEHGRRAVEETDDAIADHNEIRDAIAQTRRQPAGSHDWIDAVGRARTENRNHIGEEERGALPDFRKNTSSELRAELAERWNRCYAEHRHGEGLDSSDRDADAHIAKHDKDR